MMIPNYDENVGDKDANLNAAAYEDEDSVNDKGGDSEYDKGIDILIEIFIMMILQVLNNYANGDDNDYNEDGSGDSNILQQMMINS